jgi:hypothetical protein
MRLRLLAVLASLFAGCGAPDVYRIDAAPERRVVEHQHCRVHDSVEQGWHYDCWTHTHVVRDHPKGPAN